MANRATSPKDRARARRGPAIRRFRTGATRDRDTAKANPEGAWSPLVWQRLARYLHDHRRLPDGGVRPADNWQRGMPPRSYLQSAMRHLLAAWILARHGPDRVDWVTLTGRPDPVPLDEALCGVLFNVSGLLHEYLAQRHWAEAEAWPGWPTWPTRPRR